MKVYFQYDGEPPESDPPITGERKGREPYKVKLTLPEKWLTGPCSKLVEFFVATYNKKFPQFSLAEADLHIKCCGVALPLHAEVGKVVSEYNDVIFTHNTAVAARAAPPPGSVLCTNYGCGKYYLPSENGADACHHHAKGPVFHDTHKFWSCCADKKALDWEEFEAIPPCVVGPHSDVNKAITFKQEAIVNQALSEAQQAAMAKPVTSAAVAESGVGAVAGGVVGEGRRNNGPREFEGALHAQRQEQQIVDGKATCKNFGCQQTFVVADNSDQACTYHKEGPVFWDTYKYWKCCPQRKEYEFDDFVKIPGCTVGPHRL